MNLHEQEHTCTSGVLHKTFNDNNLIQTFSNERLILIKRGFECCIAHSESFPDYMISSFV